LVGAVRTPDYNICVDETTIVIEVKEMEVNAEEQQKISEFDTKGTVSIKSVLGKRVRDKITDAAGKFKEAARNGHPSIGASSQGGTVQTYRFRRYLCRHVRAALFPSIR
jgi:hypothetical protein